MSKVLILGSKGMLGGQLMKVFGNEVVGWDRSDFDLTKISNFKFQISNLHPTVIINCVAYNDVEGAEDCPDIVFRLNADAVGQLALLAKELDIPLVHFSTNYVFGGEKGEYKETDLPNPLGVYAKSKHQGELEIQKIGGKFYIIRTAVLFGPKGESELSKKSFVELMFEKSGKTDTIKLVDDEISSITYAVDLAVQVKQLLEQNKPFGIYHITNSGSASWYDFAKEIFNITGKKVNLEPVSAKTFPRKAPRPKKTVLLNTKLPQLRPWQEALRKFLTS